VVRKADNAVDSGGGAVLATTAGLSNPVDRQPELSANKKEKLIWDILPTLH
jgi:hypothetical protein